MIMNHKLGDIRDFAHEQARKSKHIERMINAPTFVHLYDSSTESELAHLFNCINDVDDEGLRSWIYRQKSRIDICLMDIRRLRQIGSQLGIPEYSTKSKARLISDIAIARKQREDAGQNP